MKAKNTTSKQIKLLICGSKNFEDKAFIFGMLNQFFVSTNGQISTIFTSKFSGACEFAREWIELTNSNLPANAKINHQDCTFDMHLAKQNISFYEEADLPDVVIQNDPFFQEGKEKLMKNGVNVVFAFPNSSGEMGPATKNIERFSELGGIKFFNGIDAYKTLKHHREQVETVPLNTEKIGLQNQHGMKKN